MRLLFIAPNRIGDAVLSLSALGHYIDHNPGIKITVAASDLVSSLFQAIPNLERIIPFNKQKYKLHWPKLWREISTTKWDIVLDMRASALAYLVFTKQRFLARTNDQTGHQVERLAKSLNLPSDITPQLFLTEQSIKIADKLISDKVETVALAPLANWLGKEWPLENFKQIANQLIHETKSQIAIFCAPYEVSRLSDLLDSLPTERVTLISEHQDLLVVAACLKKCSLFIGNDSGLMHLSAAVEVPTIAIFGPTDDRRYGPWGKNNKILRTPESFDELNRFRESSLVNKQQNFIKSLSPDYVYNVIKDFYFAEEPEHA